MTVETIEIEDNLDEIQYRFLREGWTDGLPIIPPTPARVRRMVEMSGRRADEVIAVLPPENAAATVEKVAVNAVMAGCPPEVFPVVLAAVEAVADPDFNLMGIQGTTNPVAPLVIVNGPARWQLGFNAGYGCFGPGTVANATVGRALRLVLINIGGGIPGEKDMAVAGSPAKYTFCAAENEEESPWEPLHIERGFAPQDSVVTVVGISSYINSLGGTVEHLAEALTFSGSNDYRFGGCPLLALNPSHAERLAASGLGKRELKQRVFDLSKKQVRDFSRALLAPREEDLGSLEDEAKEVPLTRGSDDILVIVAGASGAGGHSLVMPSFGNTRPVSSRIRTPS